MKTIYINPISKKNVFKKEEKEEERKSGHMRRSTFSSDESCFPPPQNGLHRRRFNSSFNISIPRRLNSIGEIPKEKFDFGSLESYVQLYKLGEGTYANVYKAISRITEKFVAIKILKTNITEGAPCTALREISLLRQLIHSNIICLIDVINTPSTLAFVVDYMELDLRDLIRSPFPISNNDGAIYLYQLLRGINFCHSQKILHRDLKPHNLLLNLRGDLKIADFGLARSQGVPSKNYTSEVVTLWYRSPDVIMGFTNYNYGIDIWSIGCIAIELFIRRPPFMGKNTKGQLQTITNVIGEINNETLPYLDKLPHKLMVDSLVPAFNPGFKRYSDKINKDMITLIKAMLDYDQNKRPTAVICMNDHVFSEIRSKVGTIENNDSVFKNGQLKIDSTKDLKKCAYQKVPR